MNVITSVSEGIIVGIISSFVFRIINHFRKPKVMIADYVAKFDVNGKTQYQIKVVNLKRSYIKNMKIYAMLATNYMEGNKTIVKTVPLKISQPDISFIDPYREKDNAAKYAIRLFLPDDLETLWDRTTPTYLNVKIYCENENSNVGAVFEKTISHDSIKLGRFAFGKSVQIN